MTSRERHDVFNHRQLDCFFNNFFFANNKGKIKTHYGSLWGESASDWKFPPYKGPIMWKAMPCHDVILLADSHPSLPGKTRAPLFFLRSNWHKYPFLWILWCLPSLQTPGFLIEFHDNENSMRAFPQYCPTAWMSRLCSNFQRLKSQMIRCYTIKTWSRYGKIFFWYWIAWFVQHIPSWSDIYSQQNRTIYMWHLFLLLAAVLIMSRLAIGCVWYCSFACRSMLIPGSKQRLLMHNESVDFFSYDTRATHSLR